MSFSKPKTFVFKHQKQNKDDNSCSDSSQKSSEGGTDSSSGCSDKLTAVTFSESYEVLNRLTSSFWPGPVTIYAPVKQLGSYQLQQGIVSNHPIKILERTLE